MRFVAISDSHNQLDSITHWPKGDVLLHAGDATFRGDEAELARFNEELGRTPYQHRVFTPGNHDWLFQLDVEAARSIVTNATVLIDEQLTIGGVKIWGSPWQPEFGNWAFNLKRGEPLRRVWNKIPLNTDVLVTHGPPLGYGDTVQRYGDMLWPGDQAIDGYVERVGCWDLNHAVEQIKPKYHIFGHIHGGYGTYSNGTTTFLNASICNEQYGVENLPHVFDL